MLGEVGKIGNVPGIVHNVAIKYTPMYIMSIYIAHMHAHDIVHVHIAHIHKYSMYM